MSDAAIPFEKFDRTLDLGARELGIELSGSEKNSLLQYLALLHKWNKAFNLSAVRDPEEMLSRHLLDSLSILPLVKQLRSVAITGHFTVLDVGTGPGLPGIPLAICLPLVNFVLLDSNGKKTRFVFQACVELGLKNVRVENTRIENYQSERQVDIVVSRAFASLADFTLGCEAIAGPATRLIAMKGQYPEEEIAALSPDWHLAGSHKIEVPGSVGERHLIELNKIRTSDSQ